MSKEIPRKQGLEFFPGRLSGGERQRVSIARALANAPKIILADEPTGNLDSVAGHSVAATLLGLARQHGCGVVIVTHDSRIVDIADRALYIVDGSLAAGLPEPASSPEKSGMLGPQLTSSRAPVQARL